MIKPHWPAILSGVLTTILIDLTSLSTALWTVALIVLVLITTGLVVGVLSDPKRRTK